MSWCSSKAGATWKSDFKLWNCVIVSHRKAFYTIRDTFVDMVCLELLGIMRCSGNSPNLGKGGEMELSIVLIVLHRAVVVDYRTVHYWW